MLATVEGISDARVYTDEKLRAPNSFTYQNLLVDNNFKEFYRELTKLTLKTITLTSPLTGNIDQFLKFFKKWFVGDIFDKPLLKKLQYNGLRPVPMGFKKPDTLMEGNGGFYYSSKSRSSILLINPTSQEGRNKLINESGSILKLYRQYTNITTLKLIIKTPKEITMETYARFNMWLDKQDTLISSLMQKHYPDLSDTEMSDKKNLLLREIQSITQSKINEWVAKFGNIANTPLIRGQVPSNLSSQHTSFEVSYLPLFNPLADKFSQIFLTKDTSRYMIQCRKEALNSIIAQPIIYNTLTQIPNILDPNDLSKFSRSVIDSINEAYKRKADHEREIIDGDDNKIIFDPAIEPKLLNDTIIITDPKKETKEKITLSFSKSTHNNDLLLYCPGFQL
jgi:hypothetical protein